MKLFTVLSIVITLCYSCQTDGDRPMVKIDSLSIVRDSIKLNPQNKTLWINLYQLQLNKADTNGAIESLKNYVQMEPGDDYAGLELAWLWTTRNDSNAVRLTNWLMKSTNEEISLRAKYIQALYFGNIGDIDRSLPMLDSVLEANYQFTDAYIEKGSILYDRKRFNEAMEAFLLGLKVEPSNKELYYWIGETHKALGNLKEAEDWQKKYEALR